ncbi:MAG: hypothetical protein Q4F84_05025, partial [Fibrobacter sp.]|nr:hypothetical protein [Fibrobacter sp.]
NGLFWSMIVDEISKVVRNNGKLDAFVKAESDLIDFGLCSEVHGNVDEVKKTIVDDDISQFPLQVLTISQWIMDFYSRLLLGDKKEKLEKEIWVKKTEIQKRKKAIAEIQEERKELLLNSLSQSALSAAVKKKISLLEKIGEMQYESIRMKKAIARGVFFSVQQKREYFDLEKELQKELQGLNSLVESIQARDVVAELKKAGDQVVADYNLIIDFEVALEKTEAELESIQKQQQTVSSLEVENGLRAELEYIRDLINLSAKRLKIESCPILLKDKTHFSYKALRECIERVMEFDPKIFRNYRVNLFGKPRVLLVPGMGNAIYDWKNNVILVPTMTPESNTIASVASGLMEYRLDVDEDRELSNSYNQLPEMKNIRSSLQLRSLLIKDYIKWMTSEYKGYRVLSKGVKDWFEHEIAPDKNDIYTPASYQNFTISISEFEKLFKEFEEKIENGIENCSEQDLWVSSILNFQKGNFKKSFELLTALLKKNDNFPMAWYNLGCVASKLMRKQDAIAGFSEFSKRNSQSWWAIVARDNIRRLQS